MLNSLFIGFLSVSSICILSVTSQKSLSKTSGPPAFFLQDPSDSLCLAGNKYRRCAIDTLWYVTGKPGSYQIHHRLVGGSMSLLSYIFITYYQLESVTFAHYFLFLFLKNCMVNCNYYDNY